MIITIITMMMTKLPMIIFCNNDDNKNISNIDSNNDDNKNNSNSDSNNHHQKEFSMLTNLN